MSTLPFPRKKVKPTVSQAARDLGVTRTHLSLVIHGHRTSKSLSSRYRAWLAQHSAAAAHPAR